MTDKDKNLLKKNYNDWAIFSIINNTKLKNKTVYGWKIIAGKKITVEVIFHIIRKFRNEIVVKAVGAQGIKILGELAAGAQSLNFYLPDDMVLFQTEVKQIESNGDVRIRIPKMIAQVDRRKDLRLFIENEMNVNIKFLKGNHGQKIVTQKFNKECFDLSGGGLSFIISQSEKGFFKMNDNIDSVVINLNGEPVKVNAEIISILEVEPNKRNDLNYKGWKVCLKWSNIGLIQKKAVQEFVFRYVNLEEAI